MTAYQHLRSTLAAQPRHWLVTGAAGFIGSHLIETLLSLGQRVTGLDNLSTGSQENLADVAARVGAENWARFSLIEGTVADADICRRAVAGVDYVLHGAGFISVPLSIEKPDDCHATNVTGTLNILLAARDAGVQRVVYASSSAVYGDDARMPKIESQIGRCLSPYGVSKLMDELYAAQCHAHYGLASIGLRYFNVFGPRQNPAGGYAAVIPQWITKRLRGEECVIHGDGGITRDFCHVANVVQANLLAATTPNADAIGGVFNVALGAQTTLVALYDMISENLAAIGAAPALPIRVGVPRPGDITHSGADITLATTQLGFAPEVPVATGLAETVRWYAERVGK